MADKRARSTAFANNALQFGRKVHKVASDTLGNMPRFASLAARAGGRLFLTGVAAGGVAVPIPFES